MKNKRLFQELIDMTTNVPKEAFDMNKFLDHDDRNCGCVMHHGIKQQLLNGSISADWMCNTFNFSMNEWLELFAMNRIEKRSWYTLTPFDQAFLMQMYLDGHRAGCL